MKNAKILIQVVGGIATVVSCDPNIDWEIRDYDIQGDEDNIQYDENGDPYVNAG
jgi:hypothetical protein